MLILTRRNGEAIMIGDNIEVRVLGVRGHHVRLGITAPANVPVHREEIYARIQRERVSQETQRDDVATRDILELASHTVPLAVIATWSDETVSLAERWAAATHLRASDNPVVVPPKPDVLNGYEDHAP